MPPTDDATAGAEPQTLASALSTLILFGLISVGIYVYFLKPIFAGGPATGGVRNGVVGARARATPNQNNRGAGTIHTNGGDSGDEILTILANSTRTPPHLLNESATPVDGLIGFRNTKASGYEKSTNNAAENRKERARLLSKILTLEPTAPPPPRGTTVVVSLPAEDVVCPKLSRVFFLLATYFNLIVVICVEQGVEEPESYIDKLLLGGDDKILSEVLPRHRILLSQSITGRVAVCRQLGSVEFVLDYKPQIKTELTRFGFRVMVYGSGEGKPGWSMLASDLVDE